VLFAIDVAAKRREATMRLSKNSRTPNEERALTAVALLFVFGGFVGVFWLCDLLDPHGIWLLGAVSGSWMVWEAAVKLTRRR
jgi:hypothetical protein